MKLLHKILCFCLLSLPFGFVWGLTPTGYWRTIDDVTGKAKAVVQISVNGGVLSGRIVKIYPRPGLDINEVCDKCSGSRHNQKILGMTILEGMTQEKEGSNTWSNGNILDPKIGKVYHCYIQMKDTGNELLVRGYIGIPLFGRSQTWMRVSGPNS